jgi:hypothetical protein
MRPPKETNMHDIPWRLILEAIIAVATAFTAYMSGHAQGKQACPKCNGSGLAPNAQSDADR